MSKVTQDKIGHKHHERINSGEAVTKNTSSKAFVIRLHDHSTRGKGKNYQVVASSGNRNAINRKKKILYQEIKSKLREALSTPKEPVDFVVSMGDDYLIEISFKPSTVSKEEIPENNNPYADESGGPKKGNELEFFLWEENKWLKYVNSLPEAERQKHLDAAKSLAEKTDH